MFFLPNPQTSNTLHGSHWKVYYLEIKVDHMILLSGLEKPEQGVKLNVKNSRKIDVHIIISKITTFYSGILQVDTSLFLAFIQFGA